MGDPRGEYAFRKYERRPFDAEACVQCGKCLSQCPVLHLPEARAKEEIAALAQCLTDGPKSTKSTESILARCTSCFSCNLICPNDCRPANLFLDIWHRRYERGGLPVRARHFLPHSVPNFRTYAIERFSKREKETVESWKRLEPADAIFYPGCNIITTPYLTFSRLFEEMDIRGALEYCCGEMYFRMGLYDQLEQVARKDTAYFRVLKAKKVYMLCTAGLNLFTNVLPQFGADFSGIEFVPYLRLLYKRLESGTLPIVKRFDGKTIALQDSCHAKLYEEAFHDWPRKILTLLGFEVLEPERSRQSMLCCGIGAGFSHGAAYGKRELISGQRACMKNARGPRADCIGAYCSGCLEMLSAAKYVSWGMTPVYHIIELIQEAIGEEPLRKQRRLAFDFLRGTLTKQETGRERFFIPPIE